MDLQEIKPRKIYEQVAEQLKKAIISGQYQPGEKLPSVRELGELLNVGQPSVREALSALRAMGLVEILQGHGTFVAKYDAEELTARINDYILIGKEDILHLIEVRKMLEVGAARSAAEKRTGKDLLEMERSIEIMKRKLTSPDEWDKADWRFHYAISQATQNPILTSLMQSISGRTQQALKENRQKLFTTQAKLEHLLNHHIAIYDSIKNGRVDKAENNMLEHLLYVETQLKESEPNEKKVDEMK